MAICINSSEYKTAACIDIHCEIQAVPFAYLSQMQPGEPTAAIRERGIAARKIQEERFKPFKGIHCNAMMTERMLHQFAEPDDQSLDMLRMAMERLKLCPRLQPHSQGGPHHRRPRRLREGRSHAHCRGHRLSQS